MNIPRISTPPKKKNKEQTVQNSAKALFVSRPFNGLWLTMLLNGQF